jgi:hypothetical protein
MTIVGPVLLKGIVADAVCAAILRLNPDARVMDRGAYLRVGAPGRCVLTADAVADALGRPFRVPADLEAIMCSFRGELALSEEGATWRARMATS